MEQKRFPKTVRIIVVHPGLNWFNRVWFLRYFIFKVLTPNQIIEYANEEKNGNHSRAGKEPGSDQKEEVEKNTDPSE